MDPNSGQPFDRLTALSKVEGQLADPKSELDQVKDLASVGCTDTEIADILHYRPKALARRYGPLIRQARAQGAADIRREQWSKAVEGNVPMLIWLGRQRLSQSQRPDAPAGEAQPARVVLDLRNGE